jgi:hypothetical protein
MTLHRQKYGGKLYFFRIFQTKYVPDTVEHRSIGEYSHVEVWNKDSVHATLSFVPEPPPWD